MASETDVPTKINSESCDILPKEDLLQANSTNSNEQSSATQKALLKNLYQQNTIKKVYALYTDESWSRLTEKLAKNKKRTFKVDESFMKDDSILQERKYGKISSNFIGIPIEEIDDSIKEPTFLFVNRKLKNHIVYRFSATKAFFLLDPLNPIRRFCIKVSTNILFDIFILLTILTNYGFLTLTTDYVAAEYTFITIYTLEMTLKLIARGCVLQPYTYLRNAWNWLDLIVVISSYVAIIAAKTSQHEVEKVEVLRTFRAFRILKILSIFSSLKTIVEALLKSLRLFVEVWILILFYMSVVALFALQLYVGVLRNKCVKTIDWTGINVSLANQSTIDSYYYSFVHNESNWMMTFEEEVYWLCGNRTGAGHCEKSPYASNYSWVCLPDIGDNPNWGYTSFDHFGWALLSSYQLLTLDFLEDLYNKLIRTGGPWNVLFCIVVVFFGSLYIIGLMLAVVVRSYEEEAVKRRKLKELQLIESEKKEFYFDMAAEDAEVLQKSDNQESISKMPAALKELEVQTAVEAKSSTKHAHITKSTVATSLTTIALDRGVGSQDLDGLNILKNDNVVYEEANIDGNVVIITPDGKQLTDRNCRHCSTFCCCYMTWLKFQNALHSFLNHPFYDILSLICILGNTIIMSTDHYPISDTWISVMDKSNMVFTVIFSLEIIIKFLCFGLFFFKVFFNIFDLIVVTASIIDYCAPTISGLSVFTVFRLFRIFKLAQSWRTMRVLLSIIVVFLSVVRNLVVIMLIMVFFFAVIGLHLFHGTYTAKVFHKEELIPRWNFESMAHSLMMIIKVLCGEWIEPLWDCLRASGKLCYFMFLPTLVLGHFMVLNLFISILLNTFAYDSLNLEEEEKEESKLKFVVNKMFRLLKFNNKIADSDNLVEKNTQQINLSYISSGPFNDAKTDFGLSVMNSQNMSDNSMENIGDVIFEQPEARLGNEMFNIDKKDDNESNLDDCCWPIFYEPCDHRKLCNCCFCCTCPADENYGKNWQLFRYTMLRIVEHKLFDGFILIIILASSIVLAFEDIYLDENTTLKTVLRYLNYLFAIIFTIEMILKCCAHGMRQYLTHFWTVIDFIIVCVAYIEMIADLLGLLNDTVFRTIRTLRALRPLRAISRWKGLEIIVKALMLAIPSILNVLLVCMVFWIIFSVIGVTFFKGKFYSCQSHEHEQISHTITPNKTECLKLGYDWVNANINFDNVFEGLLALYQVATFEGWMQVMQSAIDSTKVDEQPIRENRMGYYAYFVAFVIVGSFFALNLFVSVIIDNFNAIKKKYEGNYMSMLLTASQRNYYKTIKKLSKKKPQNIIDRPDNFIQGFCYDVSISNKFDFTIVFLIFCNMLAMMVKHYKQSNTVTKALNVVNAFFTSIFILEAVIKIIGLRMQYFKQLSNIYDFIIVILSILSLVIRQFLETLFITPNLLRMVHIIRISSELRLINASKGVHKLFFALIISLPALLNILTLLFLVMFIYAIIGMTMFGYVKHANELDDLMNFENFERSMLLLFRLSTCAGWNKILDPLLVKEPDCNSTYATLPNGEIFKIPNGNCSYSWMGIVFMISFVLLSFLIILNIYIAVILENFIDAHEQEEIGITEDDFDSFYSHWKRHDPHATQYIEFEHLSNFVAELEKPLKLSKPNVIALVSFDLPIFEGEKIHCLDLLIALVKHVVGNVEEYEEYKTIEQMMKDKFTENFPTYDRSKAISTTLLLKKEDVYASTLQRAWRYYKGQQALLQGGRGTTVNP